jgi:ferredoxin
MPGIDMDRCSGCGVCAVGWPTDVIQRVEKPETPKPPLNRKGPREAMASSF